tara:strand:+ start:121 stop:333 length:213 start_codon:yes stop_codon:yes gene_type:complete
MSTNKLIPVRAMIAFSWPIHQAKNGFKSPFRFLSFNKTYKKDLEKSTVSTNKGKDCSFFSALMDGGVWLS